MPIAMRLPLNATTADVLAGPPAKPGITTGPPINPWGSTDTSTVVTPPASAQPSLIDRIVQQESGGNPNAVSPKGATGTMQIMPPTARDPGYGLPNLFDLARQQGIPVADDSDATLQALLRNDQLNRAFGTAYFNKMLEINGGDEKLALASYNAGPGAVQQYGGVPPFAETQDYVNSIGYTTKVGGDGQNPFDSELMPFEYGNKPVGADEFAPVAAPSKKLRLPHGATTADVGKAIGAEIPPPFSQAPAADTQDTGRSWAGQALDALVPAGKQAVAGAADAISPYMDAFTGAIGNAGKPERNLAAIAEQMQSAGQLPEGATPAQMEPLPTTEVPRFSEMVDSIVPRPEQDDYLGRLARAGGRLPVDLPKYAAASVLARPLGPLAAPAGFGAVSGTEAALQNYADTARGDTPELSVAKEAGKGALMGAPFMALPFIKSALGRAALAGGGGALIPPLVEQRGVTLEDAVLGGGLGLLGAGKGPKAERKPSLDAEFPERPAAEGGPTAPDQPQLPGPAGQLALPDLRGEVMPMPDRRGESGAPIPIQPNTRALPAPERPALPDLRGEVIPMPAPQEPLAAPSAGTATKPIGFAPRTAPNQTQFAPLPAPQKGAAAANAANAITEQGAPLSATGTPPLGGPVSTKPRTVEGAANTQQGVPPAAAPVGQGAAPSQSGPAPSIVELKKRARNLGVKTTGTVSQLEARVRAAEETLATAEPTKPAVSEPPVSPAPAPTAKAPETEIPRVYRNMPDATLNEMAAQGVRGAQAEKARRAAEKGPAPVESKQQAELPLGDAPLTPAAVDAMPLTQVQKELRKRGKKASGVGGVMAARARLKAALNEEAAANPTKAVEPPPRGKSDMSRSDTGSSLNPGEVIDAVVKKLRRGRKTAGDRLAERGVLLSGDLRTRAERKAEGKAKRRDLLQPLAEFTMRPVDAVSHPKSKRLAEEAAQDFSHYIGKAGAEREQIMFDVAAQIPRSERGDMRIAHRVLTSGNAADIARLKKLRPELATAVEKTLDYYKEKLPEIKENARAKLIEAYGEETPMRNAMEEAFAASNKRELSMEDIQAIAKTHKANAQDLLDIVNDYKRIDKMGIEGYVPNTERGQIKIVARNAQGDLTTIGFAVNETMAARKAEAYMDSPVKSKGTVEILLDFQHPESYRHLEQTSPKVYSALKNQFGTELRKISTDLNAKMARQKAAGILNRNVRVGTTQKFAGPLAKRKGILEGDADLLDVTLSYITSVNRALAVNRYIVKYRRMMHELPEGDRKILTRLFEDMKGRYYWEDRVLDSYIEGLPKSVRERLGSGVSSSANIGLRTIASINKLASRPIAGIINAISGKTKTLVSTKWDNEYSRKGNELYKTKEGEALWDWARWRVGEGISTDDLSRSLGRTTFTTAKKAVRNRVWDVAGKELLGRLDSLAGRGVQSFAESWLRRDSFFANYVYLKERFPDMPAEELRFEAAKATRTQQGIYDIANLPKIMRISPSVKTTLQFKMYLVNELSFLRGLSRRDKALYLGAGAAVAGPSYYIAMAKSIPFLAQAIDWTDLEEYLNSELGWAYRGGAGALGMDVTAAYSPQLPTQWEDVAGPAFSDLIRLGEVLAEDYPTGRDVDQYLDDTVIAYRNFSAFMEALENEDGRVGDDRGRPLYYLDTLGEKFIKGALGAKTMEESQRQLINQAVVKDELAQRNAKTRLVTTILDELRDNGRISKETRARMVESGLSNESIRNAGKERRMKPEERQLFNASLRNRPTVLERQRRGYNAFQEE